MKKIFYSFFILFGVLEAKECCPPKVCGYNAPYKILTCNDLFIELDFLYWQGLEENLTLGCNQSSNIYFPYKFSPGFRIQAGKFFSWDDWQVFVEYTRFYQTVRKNEESEEIYAYWAPTTDVFTSVRGKWGLKFDEASLSLGRDAYVGKCTTSKIHIGLEGLWIRQRLRAKYSNVSNLIDSKNELCSWAIGPRIGWDTKWLICNGFQIFTEVRGALVYTDYTTNKQNIYTNDVLNYSITKDCSGYIRTILDMSMGFGWGCYFKKAYFNLKAGYSARVLWNQNQFIQNPCYYSNNADLYLHGLTLYFAFYF